MGVPFLPFAEHTLALEAVVYGVWCHNNISHKDFWQNVRQIWRHHVAAARTLSQASILIAQFSVVVGRFLRPRRTHREQNEYRWKLKRTTPSISRGRPNQQM